VAEELATEHCGFYSDKKQGVVAAFSQIYRSWGLTAHRGWVRLMLDRRCLVEVPNAPRHRAERAHAEADHDEETPSETTSTLRPATVPDLGVQLAPRRRPALYCLAPPPPPSGGGEAWVPPAPPLLQGGALRN